MRIGELDEILSQIFNADSNIIPVYLRNFVQV